MNKIIWDSVFTINRISKLKTCEINESNYKEMLKNLQKKEPQLLNEWGTKKRIKDICDLKVDEMRRDKQDQKWSYKDEWSDSYRERIQATSECSKAYVLYRDTINDIMLIKEIMRQYEKEHTK